jgi:hypothetical protein
MTRGIVPDSEVRIICGAFVLRTSESERHELVIGLVLFRRTTPTSLKPKSSFSQAQIQGRAKSFVGSPGIFACSTNTVCAFGSNG